MAAPFVTTRDIASGLREVHGRRLNFLRDLAFSRLETLSPEKCELCLENSRN